MKALFSIIGLTSFLFIVSFAFPNDSEQHFKTESQAQTGIIVQKIYETDGIVRTELKLDTAQYSQCDTCSSNLVDAIELKRKLTDSLTVQNAELYENWVHSIALNDTLEAINKKVDIQILKSKVQLKKNFN